MKIKMKTMTNNTFSTFRYPLQKHIKMSVQRN